MMNTNKRVGSELERATSSSPRVVPINFDDGDDITIVQDRLSLALLFKVHNNNISFKVASSSSFISDDNNDDDEEDQRNVSGSRQSPDDWLPITQSRTGNSFTAALHFVCSGLGLQSLTVPVAFVSLGWVWGCVCLAVLFGWQMYTTWVLIQLHEPTSTPHTTGPRYSRFVVLSIVAFGPTLGKLLAIFPTLYLSGGTCSLFVIRGGEILELLSKLLYSHHLDSSPPVTPVEWFLIFVCVTIFLSQFFPTLNSLAPVSLIGSVSAVIYLSLLWILSITTTTKHHPPPLASTSSVPEVLYHKNFRGIFDAISLIALTFRGHNLILEIQGTMPTSPQRPSRKLMFKGVTASYVVIAMCIFPVAIGGYWSFGNTLGGTTTNGILEALTSELLFHKHKTSSKKWVLATIYITMLIHFICAFNLYAMLAFDNLERVIYVSKNKKACPRWVRSAIRVFYGGVAFFIATAFPFIGKLGPFLGAICLPLTVAYPCFMWIAIRKRTSSRRKWSNCMGFNLGAGCLGIGLSLLLVGVALWNLVEFGLEANFFNPH